MFKVREDQERRNRRVQGAQRRDGAGTDRDFRDGRIKTRFQSAVQLRVIASGWVLVRVVVGTLCMGMSVLLMCRFNGKMAVPVYANDHASVQAKAIPCQDREADKKAGSDAKWHD